METPLKILITDSFSSTVYSFILNRHSTRPINNSCKLFHKRKSIIEIHISCKRVEWRCMVVICRRILTLAPTHAG